jgi:hypothetical protein
MVKENSEHELGVDDFAGIGQIICQYVYNYLLLRGRCMAPVTI